MTDTVNLVDNAEVTVRMLANPLEWRVRVVEEIVVDAATTCQRRRSLQIAPLRSLLGFDTDDDTITHALVALHVAPVHRGPLLDLDIEGPDGAAWLLPRTEIAARQALFLAGLATACGEKVDDDLKALLGSLCGFTGEFVDGESPTMQYFADGLGRVVSDDVLQRWHDVGNDCQRLLRPRLDVFEGYSAMESPAFIVPELFAASTVTTDADATKLLVAYRDLVVAVAAHADNGSAEAVDFMNALADYGNYYDMMVAVRLPLDEPSLIKYSERRALTLTAFRNQGQQSAVVADARTNHVTFKLTDPNLRIRSFKAYKAGTTDYAFGAFRFLADPQYRAFYAHDPDRDYRIVMSFQLGLLQRLQAVPYLVAVVLVLLSAGLIGDGTSDLRTLAVVAGPAALAASVLLAREPSTLGSRLRLASSGVVAVALLVLVGVSTVLYVTGDPPPLPGVPNPNPTPTPTSTLAPTSAPTSTPTPTPTPTPTSAGVSPTKRTTPTAPTPT